MARVAQKEGMALVALRTEGAIIIPKKIRNALDLKAGDLIEINLQGKDIVLHPRPVGRFSLRGVPAVEANKLTGLVHLGGNALLDKHRLYE